MSACPLCWLLSQPWWLLALLVVVVVLCFALSAMARLLVEVLLAGVPR